MRIERSRLSNIAFVAGVVALVASGLKLLFTPPADTIFRVGIAAGVILLAAGVFLDPDRVKAALGGRQGRYGSNALVLTLAFAGILVVLNYLAFSHPQHLDLTEDQQFAISRETKLLLSELAQPVQLVGFYTPDRSASRDQIRPILEQYQELGNGFVSYEFIDPRSNPLAADQYGITRDASLAVTVGENHEVVDFPSEVEITSAIVRLTNPEQKAVYFLTGHGELDFNASAEPGLSQLKSALEAKNYLVEQLNLLAKAEIPADAAVLVIAGPQQAMEPGEIELLDQYLSNGGSLLAMLEPSPSTGLAGEADSLNLYLGQQWGIQARNDFVIDLAAMHPLVGLSFGFGAHSITDGLRGLVAQFPSARSIESTETENTDLNFVGLVTTSERSWGETDFAALADANGSVQPDEGVEAVGPLNLAAAVEDRVSGTRIVIIGDSDFVGNAAFLVGVNGDLAVNSVDWAAKQDNLIDITPRNTTQRQVIPATRSTVLMLILGTAVVIPGGILAAGGRVWWERRKRA